VALGRPVSGHFTGGAYYMSFGRDAVCGDVVRELAHIVDLSGGKGAGSRLIDMSICDKC
jgi:hypothetical protein